LKDKSHLESGGVFFCDEFILSGVSYEGIGGINIDGKSDIKNNSLPKDTFYLIFEVEQHDTITLEHVINVGDYARDIGRLMGLSEEDCYLLYMGGLVHDIGKLEIPDPILHKPSKLTKKEFDIIKTHPIKGYNRLIDSGYKEHEDLLDVTLHHHERLDGSGYPFGLKGDELSLFTRILGVVDSFDAMTTSRPYRKKMTDKIALKELKKGSGITYDRQVVKAMDEVVKRKSKYS